MLSLASLEVRLVNGSAPDGLLPILDSLLTTSGPSAYQFRTTGGRITTAATLGGATALLEAAGFHPVRVLAERDGERFTEGWKPSA